MADEDTQKFTTHRRAVTSNDTYEWGGESGEAWGDAIDTKQNIAIENGSLVPSDGSVIEDFESGDLTEYFGSTGQYTVSTSAALFDTYGVVCDGSTGNTEEIFSTNGLNRYPQAGDVFACYIFDDDTGGGSFPGGNPGFAWGVQDESNHYRVDLRVDDDNFRLGKLENDDFTIFESKTTVTVNYATWYEIAIEWGTDGNLTVYLYEIDQSTGDRQSTLDSITGSSTTFTDGGIGFSRNSSGGTAQFDEYRVTGGV